MKKEFFEVMRAIIRTVGGKQELVSEESYGKYTSLHKAQDDMERFASEKDADGMEDPYYQDDDTIMILEDDTEIEWTVRLRR